MYTVFVKNTLKMMSVSILGLGLVSSSLLADNYPNKAINVVVGFGIGGSADRMTRSMSTFLADEIEQRIKIINKKGAATQIAANYVLKKPANGYTMFASTFSPYMATTILSGGAKYKVQDFSFINIQWFDFELFAVNKDTKFKNMVDLMNEIKNKPKTLKAAVVQGSGGHLMLNLLLEKYNIPRENLNLVTYSSGGKARTAVAGGQVDLIVISAQGSESIREFIRPLAVLKDKRMKRWDAPTLNEAIAPLGFKLPVLPGSMRGFAVSSKFKKKYPNRFKKLTQAMQQTLATKGVQKFLKKSNIGYTWTGPEKSNQLILNSFDIFKEYAYLLKK